MSFNNVSVEKKETSDLIRDFESDMTYDSHRDTTKFRRSPNQMELVRRGASVLNTIVAHLRSNPPEGSQMATAWGNLLLLIQKEIDPEQNLPRTLADTEGWILWAESVGNT